MRASQNLPEFCQAKPSQPSSPLSARSPVFDMIDTMPKTVLFMAVSADGFIASVDDEASWVSDASWQSYQDFVASCDIILVGRKTFELMPKDEFVTGPEYMVVTDDPVSAETGSFPTISIKSKDDMPHLTGNDKIGIIGGGELNGRLAKLGVIDEMILDIEPVELGVGVRLFGKHEVPLKLKLIESKRLDEHTIERHYAILH